MKHRTIYIISLILGLFAGNLKAQQIAGEQKPKVVIGIVVENMRPDYIQRYWNKFQPNGFKKLYTNGAVCTNVNITQHVQSYASGTATLFTGVYPSVHGITDKTWYDRFKKKVIDCTDDEYYFTVGAETKSGNASPVKLLSTTITDNLKIFSMGKSKVFSVAMNRESAIFAAGHAANGAYWLDVESGRMVSSSYYVSTFPDWVRIFNSENKPEIYSYRNWTTLLPETSYTESVKDDYFFERGYYDTWKTFPHNISRYSKRSEDFRPLKTTPFANLIIKDFTIELLKGEDIGNDENIDFITAVFSSMDYENGSFGPVSLEMQDLYLYLDQYIAELIDFTENKFGKENVLFFLTANTSASYPVSYLKGEFNLPIDNFSPESSIALLNSYLNILYGDQKWVEYSSELQVYLDHDLIAKHKVDLNEIRNVASDFINQFEGVRVVLPAHHLESGYSGNSLIAPLYNTYSKGRSGDFLFLLKDGWQPSYKFNRVNYTDQTHIPLVFYGAHIQAKEITEKYNAVDLVPTLSYLLNIPVPDKIEGTVIKELKK
jgi:predicted AlkP superfamily pyrophosphatase or phosphodiesterase